MVGNIMFIYCCNITRKHMPAYWRKIFHVGFLSKFVPLAGKYALSTMGFKSEPHPANPGKQINKPERNIRFYVFTNRQNALPDGIRQIRRGITFPQFPAANCADIYVQHFSYCFLAIAIAGSLQKLKCLFSVHGECSLEYCYDKTRKY